MQIRWSLDPTYSHGYLVPLIGLVILWFRRDRLPAPSSAGRWYVPALALAGVACQLTGAILDIQWLCGFSLLIYLSAVAMCVGGWPILRWAAPAIAFLLFMIPLPYRVESEMRQPLRHVSTVASCFAMQIMGLPAVTEGNIIVLNNTKGEFIELGVVDACSGLKMFIVFVALSAAVALLIQRPWLDRLIILLSAAPIAILCNVIRITVTGLLYATVSDKWAEMVFHDLAGWLMMPMALGFLWLELKLLSLVLVENQPTKAPVFNMAGTWNAPERSRSVPN
jgi:exosortase